MAYLGIPGAELIDPVDTPLPLAHALFDFDGTLSLLREGWQQIMEPMMIEYLLETEPNADPMALGQLVHTYVGESTGQQTIFQMIWLAEQITARGGTAMEALDYKQEYLVRLDAHTKSRIDALTAGRQPPAAFLMPGSVECLEHLNASGLICYVASGTDIGYVHQEAAALGLTRYLKGGVFGALDNWKDYSKARVVKDILAQNRIGGASLITFGDGYVEIENTRAVGGIAVGVASKEDTPGQIDPWKRERLIRAGAQVILADLGPVPLLIDALLS